MKRIYLTILLALVTSVGMMNAKVTWNSSNISNLQVYGTQSYSKEGVTLSANNDLADAFWVGGSHPGISFNILEPDRFFTFSNTLGKNFTKIEMSPNGSSGWEYANLGSGWSVSGEYWNDEPITVTWTGNASTVDLLNGESSFNGETVKSIVFYFEGDSEEPDPTYTVALQAGTVNANKVTLSATSAIEGATITVTPDEEYQITAFSAKYNTTQEAPSTLDPGTGAYSFTMPAYAVTIEATIALKPVPEGDIFAGFTATAGSDGFDNEGSAKLVDNKFTPGTAQTDWTKWCANNGHKSVPTGESESCWWIDFEASAALNLTGYILTTGNDTGSEHGRNPKNWLLKAKLNAGDAWTTIATVTNDVTMKNQSFKDYKFFVDQSGTYKYFRFEVSANQGAGVMQLCELRLIGAEVDVFSVAGTMNGWSTAANPMTLVGEDLYMAEINLGGENEFKIVKNNATWYGADKINSLLSDVKMTGDNDISINLPASSLVKFYWDAANEKVYLNLNPATITCTVAGVQALMGEEWSTTAAANDMTNNGDSTFTLVKNGVNLSAGNYAYKVAYNHNWDVSFGNAGENAVLNIGSTGVYDVTFTFNWKTKEVLANAVEQTPFVIENGYYIAGVINGVAGWTVFDLTADRKLIHSNEEYEEWYKDITLATGDEFKVVYVENNAISTWYPSGNNNNYVVEADHAGDKTVYFRPDGQGGSGWHEGVIYVQPNPIQLNLVAGWNTVCLPYAAEIANVDAYEIQDYNFGGGTISLTPSNDTLTAAKSYLINAAAAGEHTATLMGGKVTTPVEVDGFLGNLSETPVVLYATDEDYAYFVLSGNEFHLLTGTATANVNQYKAYIRFGKASAPSILRIVNVATNIQNVEGNETAVKFIENGKLFIKKNGVVYDAVGTVVK